MTDTTRSEEVEGALSCTHAHSDDCLCRRVLAAEVRRLSALREAERAVCPVCRQDHCWQCVHCGGSHTPLDGLAAAESVARTGEK